jgi:1-acyl-sn-glycerol-3-phosphate acyltransferase
MATRPGIAAPLQSSRLAGRAVRAARGAQRSTRKVTTVVRRAGFPYRKPSVPRGVEVPEEPSKLGPDFETEWARSTSARAARKMITAGPLRLMVRLLADPTVEGTDRLADLRPRSRDDDPPAVIFAPNHHSHLDTPLSITAIPEPWRSKLIVAAAADYFFTNRVKGSAAAIALNAIPIDRESTSRRSADQIRTLIEDGWSLIIYPEGGRSPDGWGQEFRGGAAFLSIRTGVPVVPMFIDGTGSIFGKGMKRPKPGKTKVVFGAPLHPQEGESTRRFNTRIGQAITVLGDEALTDWWTARRRAAQGTTPSLTGPEHTSWRRTWALAEHRKRGMAGRRTRQKRTWPDLG